MARDAARTVQAAVELTDAIASGTPSAIARIYAPDVVVWHNTDELTQTRDELLAGLDSLHKAATVHIDVINRAPVADGFVQTHRWTFTGRNGATLRFTSAFWVQLDEDYRVVRLDEYIDSTSLAALGELVGAGSPATSVGRR